MIAIEWVGYMKRSRHICGGMYTYLVEYAECSETARKRENKKMKEIIQ